ncbi:MAG TPA: delta-60 repeat domain-containing protein, partial [Pseudomonadales bacterium]|nr:delta-60 repeat domain-containing protein [Pseudomonadales bacterium]
YAYSLLRQSDGKLVAAGSALVKYDDSSRVESFALLRLNEDGSKDESFGIGGVVTTTLDTRQGHKIYKVIQQLDGKLVVAGSLPTRGFAVARYNVDGSLDMGFGDFGAKITQMSPGSAFGYKDEALSMLSLPDGRLVVGGLAGSTMALAVYTPDGALDLTVNGTGQIQGIAWGRSYSEVDAMIQQPDGRLLLAGVSSDGGKYGNMDFTLARLFIGDSDGDGMMDTMDPFPLDTDNNGVNNVDEPVP